MRINVRHAVWNFAFGRTLRAGLRYYATTTWKSIIRNAVIALGVVAMPAAAHAKIIEYDFAGVVTFADANNPFVQDDDPITGFLRFDAATAPSNPGHWQLPSAVFKLKYGDLNLRSNGGASAEVGPNGDFIQFMAGVEDLPFVDGAFLTLVIQTFTDGTYSLTDLPTTAPSVPPSDIGITLLEPNFSSGTDYLVLTAHAVPEPPTWLLLGFALSAVVLSGLKGRRAGRVTE